MGFEPPTASHPIRVAEPVITEDDRVAVLDVLKSSWISGYGPAVAEFEGAFSGYCGARFGIATCSGTTALHLALAALDLQPGDEVVVPAFAIVVAHNAVRWAGGTPVLVDSESATWNIDPAAVEAALTQETRAIVAVHTYGLPCDMRSLRVIAESRSLAVVEDAAEAHGGELDGARAGSLGDIASFSFFTNKAITTGEGGMVVTSDEGLADRSRGLRDLGRRGGRAYVHEEVAFNYRLSAMQAALGASQLSRIDANVERRRRVAGIYRSAFAGSAFEMREEPAGYRGSDWMSGGLLPTAAARDRLAEGLRLKHIETRPFFHPVHRQPFFEAAPATLPVAERLGDTGLLLPSGHHLTDDEVHYVVEQVREVLAGR